MMPMKVLQENKLFGWNIFLLILLVVIILCVLSFSDLTPRESALFGTVLTFLSILAGGLITHTYSNSSNSRALEEVADYHQKNLRTYALKAAEKVNNLSKELARLSTYLSEELQENDYRSVEEELLAKEERIQSAIHILQTLKSANDTSLSDWRGVIGEELEEQMEEEAERTEELNDLLERFSVLEASHIDSQKKFDTTIFQGELDNVKKGLRNLTIEITGAPLKRNYDKKLILVNEKCPACGNLLSYRQRSSQKVKAITCKICNTNLISEYSESDNFMLRPRKSVVEHINCPECESQLDIELDEWPTASTTIQCNECSESLRVSRASGSIKVNIFPQAKSKYPLDEELIERVRNAMPEQPWPKQIHKTVADQFGLPHQQIQRAIQHLIRTGVFMDQVDGEICTTAEKIKLMREAGTKI